MKTSVFRNVLKMINNYGVFFLTVAFAVSCCMMLFVSVFADSMNIELTHENISEAAKLTFGNVVLITALFGTFDILRRKLTVERPVRIITEATERIMQGDFSVRIKPMGNWMGMEGFNQIAMTINRMAKELSGTETLRTDFIANVSHEMKTPLAVMNNYATMLRQPGLSEEEKEEYAKAISRSSRQLARLITNVLKLNKLENQQIFPQPEQFDLGEHLRQCLLQFEDAWEKKELNIETDIEDSVLLRSDPELLGLVWSNLISNAIKFTPEGGTVAVSLKALEGQVEVSVRDTGCGITPEVGRHIFEKFYQGDTSHATQGNGLGLALVKRVMDILGGEISVQSVSGQGSVFTVRLRRD